MILQAAVLSVLFHATHSFVIPAPFDKTEEYSGNSTDDEDFSVSALLEKANVNLGKSFDDPLVIFGDIAVPAGLGNADPCTSRQCLWPKATDGNVYIPFRISDQYSTREKDVIRNALNSFATTTCIRFTPQSQQRDFVDIQSRGGCYSFVGRQGSGQIVSLSRQGCVFHQIVQHEILHALGFNHEQTRSDRDLHVRILLNNVIPGQEHNFRKIDTNNLGTPYDYNSVMHYGRFAFSRNREPTIIPIPDPNVSIGRATEMSPNDILRVNLLYNCSSQEQSNSELEEIKTSKTLPGGKTDVELEIDSKSGRGGKFHLPSFDVTLPNIKSKGIGVDIPNVEGDISLPKVKSPDLDVSIEGPEIKGVKVSLPSVDTDLDIEGPQIKGQKFKMPKFDVSLPKVNLPEGNVSIPAPFSM